MTYCIATARPDNNDSQFRMLVNGFAYASFPSLNEAMRSVPASGSDDESFEIYDVLARQFVWTLPRRKDSRTYRPAIAV